MKNSKKFPFELEQIKLSGAFYVDEAYAEKHPHMIHQHRDVLELLYVYSGVGRYQVGSREYVIREGDMVICNARTLHGEAPFQEHNIQTYCCALSGVQLEGLDNNCLIPDSHRPVISLQQFQGTIHHIMPEIYQLFSAEADRSFLTRQLSVSVLLMTYEEMQRQESERNSNVKQRTEDLVRHITEYLDMHYTEPLRMEEISRQLHVSVSHLSHLFKRETGLSPKQYIIHRRVGEAQSLLVETKLPIHEIEEQLGFGSSCHLTAIFKKYVGISPREYRKHFTNEKK